MTCESFLLVPDSGDIRADRLKLFLVRKGKTVRETPSERKNALDRGREEFYGLCADGEKPVVAGLGDGAALACAIAQKCPAGGLICLSPRVNAREFERRRLLRDVSRNLFLIVAPTVLAVDSSPSPLARRIANQISPDLLRIIQRDGDELWSDEALSQILEQLHNIPDTKALVLRQILRL